MCNWEQRRSARRKYAVVVVTTRATFRRLALQIERDLLTHKHLSAMLAEVDATIADHRRELRNLKTRMAKDKSK